MGTSPPEFVTWDALWRFIGVFTLVLSGIFTLLLRIVGIRGVITAHAELDDERLQSLQNQFTREHLENREDMQRLIDEFRGLRQSLYDTRRGGRP